MELDLSVEVIARECGYSSYYFSRIFKELVGMNPVEYIKQIRIREAKRRLEEQNIIRSRSSGDEASFHAYRTEYRSCYRQSYYEGEFCYSG